MTRTYMQGLYDEPRNRLYSETERCAQEMQDQEPFVQESVTIALATTHAYAYVCLYKHEVQHGAWCMRSGVNQIRSYTLVEPGHY